MDLAARLAGFEMAEIPVWVFDLDHMRMRWVNDRALEMWRTERDEFLARDWSDTPISARTRLEVCMAAAREGRRTSDEWTVYPRGIPVTHTIHMAGIPLDDGRLGLLNQAIQSEKNGIDPALLRGIESLRHTSVGVALVDEDGAMLMQNPASIRAFGDGVPFAAWFVADDTAATLLRGAAAGDVVQVEGLVRTTEGERWYGMEARSTRDPVTGHKAVLVHQVDQTARRGAERAAVDRQQVIDDLNATLRLVDRQRRQIASLSAPILDVGERTLAVPIIGDLDAERSAEITARLLRAIAERGVDRVILDLTGAGSLDAASAGRMIALLRATELLGARPILTGIRSALARALVEQDVDLAGICVLRSLAEGLQASRTP